jgi:hypothetical protein
MSDSETDLSPLEEFKAGHRKEKKDLQGLL